MSPGVGTWRTRKISTKHAVAASAGDYRQEARAAVHPHAARRDGRSQQERERRINRHGIVFLRGGKREKHQHKANPAKRQQARFCRSIHGPERKLGNRRKINAPGKQPHQMKRPEIEARDGVVIPRIAQVQKAQKLLIDEEKPEKAVILARAGLEGERKIGRIAQCGQNVPGRRDRQRDQSAGEKMQSLPCFRNE